MKKEKIDLSLLNKIFIPNMPTQTVLTDVGSNLDVIELIKFFLNPTPNPKIYRELGDGLIKNYGVTVVIDSSISCFGGASLIHSLQTIKMLLSSLSIIELPCFDLIIATESNPVIICNERNTFEILSDNSQIWPIFFSLITRKISNVDLASSIRAAFNLHNYRRNEHTDFLFVLTDGLFSESERQKITDNVHYCISRGMKVFGIGIGMCPYGIEKLFPQIIYSKNPMKLIEGISDLSLILLYFYYYFHLLIISRNIYYFVNLLEPFIIFIFIIISSIINKNNLLLSNFNLIFYNLFLIFL